MKRHPIIRTILNVVFLLWWLASLWWWALFGMSEHIVAAHIMSLLMLGVVVNAPGWEDGP